MFFERPPDRTIAGAIDDAEFHEPGAMVMAQAPLSRARDLRSGLHEPRHWPRQNSNATPGSTDMQK